MPVIPPRPERRRPHTYHITLDKERNLVERMFAKLKQFWRFAARYGKLIRCFRGFVLVAAIML